MARGYIDFSPLYKGKENDQTGQLYGNAIRTIGSAIGEFAGEQKAQKQNIYGEIEEKNRAITEFTNNVVRDASQQYVDKINNENIELLRKNRFFLNPQDKAKIQSNFLKIDEFVNQLKGFEQGSTQAFKEYNSAKGMGMYEDPSDLYENVLESLTPDPSTGNIDESKLRMSLNGFSNTDTGKWGLRYKPIAPDEYVFNLMKNWMNNPAHQGEETMPVLETYNDPRLGMVKASKTTVPVDWNGFSRYAVGALASDEQSGQMFKFVSSLKPEEKQLATAKYGKKDEFGRLNENPLIPLMEYYINDKLNIKDKQTDIVNYGPATVVAKNRGNGGDDEKYAPKDTTPKTLTFNNFTVTGAITNPDAPKKAYPMKDVQVIDDKGNLGDKSDRIYEVANERVATVNKDGIVSVRDVSTNGRIKQVFSWMPIEGNEQIAKEAIGERLFNDLIKTKGTESSGNLEDVASDMINFRKANPKFTFEEIVKGYVEMGKIKANDKNEISEMIKNMAESDVKKSMTVIKSGMKK